MPFPPIPLEMLIRLVHEGSDGSFSAGLISTIVGSIQEGNLLAVHDGFHDR